MTYQYGAVCRAKQGQNVSGDVFVVCQYGEGQLLAAVIDGLGGGEEAAKAARAAEQVLQEHPEWSLKDLTNKVHTQLHNTRGAVMGLLRLEHAAAKASYVGVGNIGVHVYSRQPIKPISKNGILGFRLPALLELHYSYDPGDLFVLYSDGVSNRFGQDGSLDIKQSPQQLSESILGSYGKTVDDATVVVVKT